MLTKFQIFLEKFIKDSVPIGCICGLLGPIAGYSIYFFVQFGKFSGYHFLQYAIKANLLSSVLSLSVLSNLIFFFLFLWLDKEKSAKGVVAATVLYVIAGFIIKFIQVGIE